MTVKAAIEALGLEVKTIDANVKAIRVAGKKFDAMVHRTAVAILVQSCPHDMGGHLDASRALTLVKAMPQGGRTNALKAWFVKHSNVRFNGDDKVGLLNPKDKGYKAPTPIEANAEPYWNLAAVEGVPEVIDDIMLDRMLQGIIKRINAAKEEGRLNISAATGTSFEGTVLKFADTLHKRAEGMKAQHSKPVANPNANARKSAAALAKDNAKDAQRIAAAG